MARGDWVLALDGGGTKTATALASRDAEVRVLPEAPGCNPQDGPGWEAVLAGCLARASEAPGGLAAAALGIPGRGEVPSHDAGVDALLAGALACPFEAMNDVALAHLGAFGGGHGVLLLAGTGSMAWARGPLGEARVGGWGDAFGDEGSANWIGRKALGLASRAMDGREVGDLTRNPTTFAQALCDRLGPEAYGPFGPLAWLMAQPGSARAVMAGVARHVDALSEDGHGDAQWILMDAAGHLARAAKAAATLAGLSPAWPWVAAGGAFASSLLTAWTSQTIGRENEPPRLTTLGGGLLHASALAGWEPFKGWAARVDARLRAAS